MHPVISHFVHSELQQGGKALGLCMKAPEKLNLNAVVCRYNVGKNGEQWRSFGQLLPVFKRIGHEDRGSCCLVSNCFSKKISIFFKRVRKFQQKRMHRNLINLFPGK